MTEIKKELPDISWQVSEKEYRADPALSYSTIARYEREGFNNLDKLFEHISTPSLTLGSMVDCLITGSQEEFDSIYYVADMPSIGEKEQAVADSLFNTYHELYKTFGSIPYDKILETANTFAFQKNWRDDTRVRVLTERCSTYYDIKFQAIGKTIVNRELYKTVLAMVKALRESVSTHEYFAPNDPWSPIKRYYQLKFKCRIDGIDYRSMADLIIVDYEHKKVIPCDLKTSSHLEWDFQESFCTWSYMIQARLYWLNIRLNMDKDDYFKDFSLENYRFIVVNKKSLTPLVWEFPYTKASGDLIDDKGNIYRDPLVIGKELRAYLDNRPRVPNGIDINGINQINCIHKISKEQ